jgi:hypothetical protein
MRSFRASAGIHIDKAKAEVLDLILGFQISQAIHVAASLGIPDLLSADPKTSTQLAAAAGAHPASLYRLMRALAAIGLFHDDERGRFSLATRGHALRSDVPGVDRIVFEKVAQDRHSGTVRRLNLAHSTSRKIT